MIFDWQTKLEKRLAGRKISAGKKLEGIRLMNELADKMLSIKQKIARRRLRNK